MDNTLSKQGYFIIALTLSKKREHIPIPCNSNHLFKEPCILSWGKTGVLKRVLCFRSSMFTWFECLILALVLCTGNVGIKPFQVGGDDTLPWAGLRLCPCAEIPVLFIQTLPLVILEVWGASDHCSFVWLLTAHGWKQGMAGDSVTQGGK